MSSKEFLALIISMMTVMVNGSVADAQDQRRPNTKSIQVSSLNSAKVIGSLGRPLGEVVTVEGIVADGDYTRQKRDSGQILLRVLAVNGKTLKHEAILGFHPYEGGEMKKPTAGMRFEYIGYETGGFSGIPEAAFVYVPRLPTSGYYFTTSFVILRDDSERMTALRAPLRQSQSGVPRAVGPEFRY